MNVTLDMSTPFIPALNINPPPSPPLPPPLPIPDPFSWSLFFKIAGALVVGGLGYYLWPEHKLSLDYSYQESLNLNITGDYPPFDLVIKNQKSNQPIDSLRLNTSGKKVFNFKNNNPNTDSLALSILLIDKKGKKHKASIMVENPPPPRPSIILNCSPIEDKRLLDIKVLNGKLPIEIKIREAIPNSPSWTLALRKTRAERFSLDEINFPYKGTFQVFATDKLNTTTTSHFTLKDSLPSGLILDCNHNAESINISVDGNHPPFQIFLEGDQEITLNKAGTHKFTYPCGTYKKGQKIHISATDNQDEFLTKNIILSEVCIFYAKGSEAIVPIRPSIPIPPFYPTPFPLPRVDINRINECTVLYVYKKGTRDNWKMRTQTFVDEVVRKKKKFQCVWNRR